MTKINSIIQEKNGKMKLIIDLDDVKSELKNINQDSELSIMEYQKQTRRTINNDLTANELLSNMVMGMLGEAGEVSEHIKKHLYQGHDLNVEAIADELGDVMWYISNLCNSLDIYLGGVMEHNIKKLQERYPNGFTTNESMDRKE